MSLRKTLRTLSVIAFFFVLSACARLVPLTPQRAVLLSASFEDEAIRAAIIRALGESRYVAETEEPGHIIARYERRGTILRVEIQYSADRYEILYLDSTGLSHETRPNGQVVISPHYQRYMQRLTASIDQEIARPEREAREAVEHAERETREAAERADQQARDAVQEQRDHELAVIEAQRRREQDARDSVTRERDRARDAELERDRLATARVVAEAESRRPVIVGDSGGGRAVPRLRFSRERAADPGYGTVRITGSIGGRGMAYDGVAGGPSAARQMRFPSYCTGFYAESPSHVLQVDASMGYLRIEASSAGDTTLAVVSEDGSVWCDDDGAGGLNPRIEGELPPGAYYVWVGSYRRDERSQYQLAVYDSPASGAERPAVREATPPRVTDLCTNMRAMQWLADVQGRLSARDRGWIDTRERTSCSAGLEASTTERWEHGGVLRSGSSWHYPNGGVYWNGSASYYPNGGVFSQGDQVYYPNGGVMISGSQYYAPNGAVSSESGLLSQALSRLPRDRSDHLMGLYRGTSAAFWRNMYLVTMVWEANR